MVVDTIVVVRYTAFVLQEEPITRLGSPHYNIVMLKVLQDGCTKLSKYDLIITFHKILNLLTGINIDAISSDNHPLQLSNCTISN